MNKEQFLQLLSQSDYPEPVEVQQPPNGSRDSHTHPFSVKALVLDGYIEIQTQGNSIRYATGDMFVLDLGQPHKEVYGPSGVKYLASRKQ
jgi:quercetin dioxygenase-like cupin family protein